MAHGLRPGMHVSGSDVKTIGKIRRLFSAGAEEVTLERADRTSVDAGNLEAEELADLSQLPATYNIGTAGTTGAGDSQGAGIAPFTASNESEDVSF